MSKTEGLTIEELMADLFKPMPFYWRWYYSLLRFIGPYHPRTLVQTAKTFIQRGRRGWADSDTWNFDAYLSILLADAFEYMAKHASCSPRDMTYEEWVAILTQLSVAFRDYTNRDYTNLETGPPISRATFEALATYYTDLWD